MEIEKELDDNFINQKNKVEEENCERLLDVVGLNRTYNIISSSNNYGLYKNALSIAISSLCGKYLDTKYVLFISKYLYLFSIAKITVELQFFKSKSFPISNKYLRDVLHSLKIIYEIPWLDDLVFVERIVPRLVAATCVLPIFQQAKLAKFWCEMSSENTLHRILHCLQEAITFQLISTEYDPTFQDETAVTFATKTMKV